jgi:hypothetical protein
MPRRTLDTRTSCDDSRAAVAYTRASLAVQAEPDAKDVAKHPTPRIRHFVQKHR